MKTDRVEADGKRVRNLFLNLDAVEENDFEVAIEVFLKDANNATEDEDRSDRLGFK